MSEAGTSQSRFSVRPRIAVGLIALVAFFVRLLHVFSYETTTTNDMSVYVGMAIDRLSLAKIFSSQGICWFPPGYAFFLKPFFLALAPEAALKAVEVAQAALGAWTCVLLYRLATRLHSRRAGLAAALMTCFYTHFLFYSSVWMSENLFIPLYLASLLMLLRAAQKPRGAALYRAGLLSGTTALVRPVTVSLLPAVLLAAWAFARREKTDGRSGRSSLAGMARALALFLAGSLTLVGPWAVRNRIAYGRFVLIAPNSAFNLAIGNQAEATGRYMEPPSLIGNLWNRMEYFQQVSAGFITNDPWGALFVVMRLKWKGFWELIPPWPLYSSNPKLYYGEHFFPFVSWKNVFFLGMLGAGVLIARRRMGSWATPACLTVYAAFYMMFFGGSRFRMPAESFFLAWAGIAAVSIVQILPWLGRARSGAWGAAVGIVLFLVLAQSGLSAAEGRSFLKDPESLIASGEQIPVIPGKPAVTLFGGPLALDRGVGHYLYLGFTAFRQGPAQDSPDDGMVQVTFLDRAGATLPWLDNPKYYLEALPTDRWVTVRFKSHIPPAAVLCRVTITPPKTSPDTIILDQPILRYARGNDAALEFVFPYLRYDE